MTVKELKEKLSQFPDNCIVCVPNINWDVVGNVGYVPAQHVSQGINELDGIVFIDDYMEDEDDEY